MGKERAKGLLSFRPELRGLSNQSLQAGVAGRHTLPSTLNFPAQGGASPLPEALHYIGSLLSLSAFLFIHVQRQEPRGCADKMAGLYRNQRNWEEGREA